MFGGISLPLSNQVTESEVLAFFLAIVGVMRFELKNVPGVHHIHALCATAAVI